MLFYALATAALQPPSSATPNAPSASAVANVPFNYSGKINFVIPRSEVAFEFAQGGVVFRATVAGQSVWMLLDNGTSHNAIDLALARSLNLKITPMTGSVETTDGTVPNIRVDDVGLTVPGQFTTTIPFAGFDMTALKNVAGHKIEAILGHDILASLSVAIDPQAGKMAFFPSGKAKPTGDWHFVALKPGPRDQIVVQVGDQQLTLTVDLGWTSEDISLTPAAWARVRPPNAQVFHGGGIGGAGKPYSYERSRLPQLTIGDLTMKDVQVAIRSWSEHYADGEIGIRLLTRYQTFFDIKDGKLALKELPSLPPPR